MKLQRPRTLLLFCLLLASMLRPAGAADPVGVDKAKNLVPNASFEEGQAAPAGWTTFAYPETSLSRDRAVAHSGSASGLIAVTAKGAKEFPCFNHSISDVKPGEEYEASVWVKTQGVKGAWGAYLVIEFFQGQKRLPWVEGGHSGGGDRDWQPLKVRAIVPRGADRMMIACGLHAEGKVWFDDAALVKLGEHTTFTGERLALRVQPEHVINSDFIGYGAHADYYLTHPRNLRRGVDDRDRQLVNRRIEEMRPGIVVVFFNYQWWEPEEGKQTPDSDAMKDLVYWLRLLNSIGTKVVFMPWGDNAFYAEWMLPGVKNYPKREGGGGPVLYLAPKLPIPEKRPAVMRSLVDAVRYLRRDQGLTNVEYVSIVCEPDNDDARVTEPADYIAMNRMLDRELRKQGLRDAVKILGPEESSGPVTGISRYGRESMTLGKDVLDILTAHTYMHQDTRLLPYWVRDRLDFLRDLDPAHPAKPFFINEFGYGGDTFGTPENSKYEYGLFLADFGLTAAREGASAVLMWCLFDTYYQSELRGEEPKQEYGLWRYRDEGWRPRPGFFSWSLVNRYARPGSKVVSVKVEPEAESVPAVAFLSPQGELTVMLVNRGPKPINIDLDSALKAPAVLRRYEYTREAVPTPQGGMLGPIALMPVTPGKPVGFTLPAESFILLTNVP